MVGTLKKTFVIRDRDVIARLSAYLEAQPLEPLLEISVTLHHKDRTLAQNSLYWEWNTLISNEWGWTKNDVHKHFIERHLVKIYERDEEGYAAMLEAVRKVHRSGAKKEAKIMADYVLDNTSTTSANVKQFTEYLSDIEKDMISKGISLPHPEDYGSALGIKQSKTGDNNVI